MPNTGNKVQVIGIVKPELKTALMEEAEAQDVSLSHLVRRILTAYADKAIVNWHERPVK